MRRIGTGGRAAGKSRAEGPGASRALRKPGLLLLRAADAAENALILIAALLILLISLYSFLDNLMIYRSAGADSLNEYRPEPEAPISRDCRIAEGQVAWLRLDGTSVDFPVMQGTDNYEYLNRDPRGEFRLSGSIFLDYRNDAEFRDGYSVLYGHHMERGAMFGALDNFAEETYFREHRRGTLATPAAVYELTLFAAMNADGSDPVLFAPGEYDRPAVTAYLAERAFLYESPPEGNIVALSTCTGDGSETRLMVFGSIREKNGI